MTITERQETAIILIKLMESEFGNRWFVQSELPGITLHTMKALVDKGYIIKKYLNGMSYYQSTW